MKPYYITLYMILALNLTPLIAFASEPTSQSKRLEHHSFHIPKSMRMDEIILDAISSYEATLREHRTILEALRERLESARRDQRPDIRDEIKQAIRSHQKEQLAFRKTIRKRVRELRLGT